jgi:hypothetical protein
LAATQVGVWSWDAAVDIAQWSTAVAAIFGV